MSDMSDLAFAPGRNSSSSGAPMMSQSTSASVSLNTLAQPVQANQHAAVARHSQRLVAHAQAARAFQHEIKLLRADVLVQRVRALWRQPPEPRSEILAPGAIQIIRVRDAHQVGGPPGEVFRLDEMVIRFHGLDGKRFCRCRCKATWVRPRKSGN